MTYESLGRYEKVIDRWYKAINDCNRELTLSKKMGDPRAEGASFLSLGLVYHSLVRYREALEALGVPAKILEGMMYRRLEPARGDPDREREAIEPYHQALGVLMEIYSGLDYEARGCVPDPFSEQQRALACLLRAEEIFRGIGVPEAAEAMAEVLGFMRWELGEQRFQWLEAEVRPCLDGIIRQLLAEAESAAKRRYWL